MSAAPAELLQAAVAVVEQDGPEALTVRAVANRAGCSTTGIYTWYGGKSGLVDALVADSVILLDRSLAPAYRTGDPACVARSYRRWALTNRTRYLIMLGLAVPGYHPSPTVRWGAARQLAQLRRLLARRGVDDPAAAAAQLHAIAHGHVMLELVGLRPAASGSSEVALETAIRIALAEQHHKREGADDE